MKRYSSVKIQNPTTDGHSVRLLPFQSFELIFSKYNSTDVFDVSILGTLITLVERQESPTHVTYKFEQKYDFSEWVEISNLFLGNVVITTKSDKIRLCIYCIGSKDQILTVINSDGFLVKMEPHQLLQVVCYDKSNSLVEWKIEDLDKMKCVRCETVANDFPKVYDNKALFCPEPRSNSLPRNPNVKEEFFSNNVVSVCTTTEYHFWMCLSISEFVKTYNRPDGFYPLGFISLKEEGFEYQSINKIELMLNVRSKKKAKLENCSSILRIASQWRERSLSYSRRSLLNPLLIENISMADSDGWFYLEVPTPRQYYPCSSDCDWKMGTLEQIKCFELKPRFINGVKIQRFLLSGIVHSFLQTINMGSVSFIVSDYLEDKREITINFWKALSPPTEMVQIGRKSKLLAEASYTEIEFELVGDNELSEENDIIILADVSEEEGFEYNEYMGVSMYDYTKKKKFRPLVRTIGDSSMEYFTVDADE